MRDALFAAAVFLALCLSLRPDAAMALAGELGSPSIARPAGAQNTSAILEILNAKDLKFRGGSYVNASTQLRYGSDAATLRRFVTRLRAFPGVTVSLLFDAADFEGTWQLSHVGWGAPDDFAITVNSSAFSKGDLQLLRDVQEAPSVKQLK